MHFFFKRNKHNSSSTFDTTREELRKSTSFISRTINLNLGHSHRDRTPQQSIEVGATDKMASIWRRKSWSSTCKTSSLPTNSREMSHISNDFGAVSLDLEAYRFTELLLQASAARDGDLDALVPATPPSTPLNSGSIRLRLREMDTIIEGVTYDAILASHLNSKLKRTSTASLGKVKTLEKANASWDREDGVDDAPIVPPPPNSAVSTVHLRRRTRSDATRRREGERGYRSLVGVSVAIMESNRGAQRDLDSQTVGWQA